MVEREKQGVRIEGFDLVIREAETARGLAHETRRASINVKCSLGARMEIDLGRNGRFRSSGPIHVSSLGGFIRVGTSQYRDDLYVYSFNGDCVVVNHVDLEKYVAGVLNSEMSAKWNRGTLEAQAVAARTYAIYQMKDSGSSKFRGLRPPFDLDSTVRDQVYEGAHQERYSAIQAVQRTRGMVLTYQGKPIKSFYHSTCGGRTETAERVWGARYPYIKAVTCGFCERSPRFNWTYTMPTHELERRLKGERLLRGSLLSIRVLDRNILGRANRIEIRGTGDVVTVSAPRVRDIVGTLNMKSTDFSIAASGGKVSFIGHGSGHGVGMCQWGAKTMGEKGYDYVRILQHYYPAATLTKLY